MRIQLRTLMPLPVLVIVLAASLFAFAVNQRVRAQASAPTATVLFRPDLDSAVKVDGKVIGHVKKGAVQTAPLTMGQHLIEADSEVGDHHWEQIIELKDTQQIVVTIPLQRIADNAAAAKAAQDYYQATKAANERANATRAAAEANATRARLEYFGGQWNYNRDGVEQDWSAGLCQAMNSYTGLLSLREIDEDQKLIRGFLYMTRSGDVTRDQTSDHSCSFAASGNDSIFYSETWQVEVSCQNNFQCVVTGRRTNCSGDCSDTWDKEIGDINAPGYQPDYFYIQNSNYSAWSFRPGLSIVKFIRSGK